MKRNHALDMVGMRKHVDRLDCTDAVAACILSQLAWRSFERRRQHRFRMEIELEHLVEDACRNDPTIIAVGQNGTGKILFRKKEEIVESKPDYIIDRFSGLNDIL